MGDLLADRTEQQAGEPAVPACSDHDEVGARRGVEHQVDGRARLDPALHVEPGGFDAPELPLDDVLRVPLHRLEGLLLQHNGRIERARTGDDRRHLPAVDDDQRGISESSLLDCPLECALRPVRAVHTDDDLSAHTAARSSTAAIFIRSRADATPQSSAVKTQHTARSRAMLRYE
jgi:hypothetical protein